jgi:uncharacterized membrane protein
MSFKIGNGLWPLILISVVLVAIAIWAPSNVVTIILSIPFLLFSPGYSLMLALFPDKRSFDGMRRGVLSLALSAALVAIGGLILNYTPWGISNISVLLALLGLMLVFSFTAWVRERKIPLSERFILDFSLDLPMKNLLDKGLYLVLGITILFAIGTFSYLIATSPAEEAYTEFYFFDAIDQTNNQKVFKEGEKSQIMVGIYNQNQESLFYGITVKIDGVKNNELTGLNLANKEALEIPVDFTPVSSGDDQRIEFTLYNMENGEVLQTIFLMIDVS